MEEWSCQGGRLLQSELHPLDWTRFRRYDVFSFGFTGPEDETGALRSRDEVSKLIAQEIAEGLPANRIVVGGFSQGAAITLVTGLTTPHQLAGLTILSGQLPIREKIKEVRMSSLILVTERFDMSSLASRTASNYYSYLLGAWSG